MPLSPPNPSSPLSQEWTLFLRCVKVFYVDDEGDDISVQTLSEVVAGIQDMEEHQGEGYVMFQYRVRPEDGDPVEFCTAVEFSLEGLGRRLEEYRGRGGEGEMFAAAAVEENTRDIVTTGGHGDVVNIGPAVSIGSNVDIANVSTSSQDFVTPSPAPLPSPVHSSTDLSDKNTPIIDLPCIPNQVPHPPLTPVSSTHRPAAPATTSPPAAVPEADFPDPPFPGAFAHDFPTESSVPNLPDLQASISRAVQSTLDALAQIGHRTLLAAQTSGFPVSNTDSFDHAHAAIDTNAQTCLRNVTLGIDSARTNLERGVETARANIEQGFDSARTRLNTSQTSTLANLSATLDRACATVSNTSRQVDTSLTGVTTQLLRTGSITDDTAEKVLTEVRNAANKMEKAVEEVTLRLQRKINATATVAATSTSTPTPTSTSTAQAQQPQQQPEIPPQEEDIYGPPAPASIPGSFPRTKSHVEDCADTLIEMGYFTGEQKDFAGAVSIVAGGDLVNALDIMEGRAEQKW